MRSDLVVKAMEQVVDAVQAALRTGDVESLDAALRDVTRSITSSSHRPAAPIMKLDEEQRLVYGWALVTTERGTPLIDLQRDVVDTVELQKSVHEFMDGPRDLGRMHTDIGVGKVVESIVFSADVQKALGIDLGMEGWFVGVHVEDDATWQLAKTGRLRMFSIGGSGVRDVMKRAPVRGSTVRLFKELLPDA